MSPTFFALVTLHFSQASLVCDPSILYFLPLLAWQVCTTTSCFFSVKMGSHKLFCPGWPGTMIFLISGSQVARTVVVSHWCSTLYFIYSFICHVQVRRLALHLSYYAQSHNKYGHVGISFCVLTSFPLDM
jgi:hypothetical protein